jgi:hypothetical protein
VKADYTIAPGGTRIFELRGSAPESESGFLEVVPDDDVHPLAFARVQQHSGGMPVAETTVRAAVPDRAFGFESDGALDRGPGIAIANPSAVDVEVLVEPWSAYGTRNQPVYTLVVPGGGHVAVFLRDIRPPFPFSSAGRFFYRLTAPTDIVATGFRGRRNSHGETVVSAIPTVRASDPETTDVLFVPHFVNGGGYRTTWSFVPAGAGSAIDSTVEHFSPDGLAVGVP